MSHEGNYWVGDNAKVYGNAEVCDSVMLEGHDYDTIEETNRVEVDIDDVIKYKEDDE